MKNTNWKAAFLSIALSACALPALADVTVSNAWIRSTVPGQKVAGAFMQIVSTADTALIEATSPSAKFIEIHEMTKEGNVMKMKAIDRLPVPAEKPVELTPTGYHMMLFELKAPLNAGDKIPLTLTFENRGGRKLFVDVEATVRPLGSDSGPPRP
jgi:copper(I)-binding protein